MKLRVLGCSGGIGGRQHQTTALLADSDILIDAGTAVGDLGVEEMAAIDHVFLTHAHIDHIAALPLLVDTVGDRRAQPLVIHALPPVIESLQQHIFNWSIWPDFSSVPSAHSPYMRFEPLEIGHSFDIGGRCITALPAEHTVPAVGYQLDSGAASLVFSGDTGPCPAFWQQVNAIANLRHLIVECAFPDSQRALAELSMHLCPTLLAKELTRFDRRDCQLLITHLKPGNIATTMQEIERLLAGYAPHMLQAGQVIAF